ncbi:hypothetical protein BKA70DRAFT_1537922 [Coprinopsis sp. MPI-PUGE-AT-0042]|nr:hypothetical protein BKA70DRAFT_1537922 [Coprinopsis sp. MPI-PUGE-AT-0042]
METGGLDNFQQLASTAFVCRDCGASYNNSRHLDAHERERCAGSKRGLSRLLGQAKDAWETRKRRRVERRQATSQVGSEPTGRLRESRSEARSLELAHLAEPTVDNHQVHVLVNEQALNADLGSPIALRKGTRNKSKVLASYREVDGEEDDLPVPLAPLGDLDSQGISILRKVDFPEVENHPDNHHVSTEATVGGPGPSPLAPSPKCWWFSRKNKFFLWRRYYATTPPSRDPEQSVALEDLDDSLPPKTASAIQETQTKSRYGPFDNISSLLLADFWWNSANEKSKNEFSKLLKVLQDPSFSLEDISNTDWGALERTLNDQDDDNGWFDDAGWTSTPINIKVPFHRKMKSPGTEIQLVGILQHRRIVPVIEEKIRNSKDASLFHYQPYEVFWDQGDDSSLAVRVQGELYNSPAFMEAQQKLQDRPPIPGCSRERVVIALMFWSDETHLTSFGSAKLWPCYMFFGNESKYRRGKTSLRLCEHIAYFETLSDDFKDYLRDRNKGKLPPKDFLTHCGREIFHEQWRIMLDDELLEAMDKGIVIMCHDGVERRFFPVPFTYSADYPEKTRIAAIKQNGKFPCTRCLVPKDQVLNMGTADDMAFREKNRRENDCKNIQMLNKARQEVKKGLSVIGDAVGKHLDERSLLPVENAFLSKLDSFGFNIYDALVVDLLHEVEIGVWKRLYEHLLRLLDAFGKRDLLAELDKRHPILFQYREIPSFGRDTIRTFSVNASEMARKAARDYEDLLQCSLPVFDSLLPSPHNEIVMDLLFLFCEWHGLAKLRLHHDLTLQLLDDTTTLLGSQFRNFQVNTCDKVKTLELQSEADRRARRSLAKGSSSSAPDAEVSGEAATASSSRRPKKFSLSTPKYHALGHYVDNIRRFGTIDSFTSEIGETNHPAVKTWYKRTNRRGYSAQIAAVERRRIRLHRLREMLRKDRQELGPIDEEGESPGVSVPLQHTGYHIGSGGAFYLLNAKFVNGPGIDDPALCNFIPKLKRHLLPRILPLVAPNLYPVGQGSQCFTNEHDKGSMWGSVELYNNRVYTLQTLKVKYTTYDVRLEEDIVRLESKPNVMVLRETSTEHGRSQELEDPYRYGQVIGIYHADVMFVGELCDGTRNYHSHRIDFLWVRWYQPVSPRGALRLQQLQFEHLESPSAFGFLDPAKVVRGVHLIPRFPSGQAPPAKSSWITLKRPEWNIYYLNRFVDRDMLMRYHSNLAIGHRNVHTLRSQAVGAKENSDSDRALLASTIFKPLPPPSEENLADDSDFEDDEGGDADAEGDYGSRRVLILGFGITNHYTSSPNCCCSASNLSDFSVHQPENLMPMAAAASDPYIRILAEMHDLMHRVRTAAVIGFGIGKRCFQTRSNLSRSLIANDVDLRSLWMIAFYIEFRPVQQDSQGGNVLDYDAFLTDWDEYLNISQDLWRKSGCSRKGYASSHAYPLSRRSGQPRFDQFLEAGPQLSTNPACNLGQGDPRNWTLDLQMGDLLLWLDPDGFLKILWRFGMSGAGTTILASIVINALEARAKALVLPICTFLEADHRVTLQLFCPCRRSVRKSRPRGNVTWPSEEELLGLLRRCAEMFVANFDILDVVDEAPVRIQFDLVKKLASLNVKLFITSRPMEAVEARFPDAHNFSIAAQDRDIDLHVSNEIARSPDLCDLLEQADTEYKMTLCPPSSRKHASLQLDALQECTSLHGETLKEFPTQIEDIYIRTWKRILDQSAKKALLTKTVLLWVLTASRSMTVEELRQAVETAPGIPTQATLIGLCRGLVIVEEESRAVCLTAKDTVHRLVLEAFPHPRSHLTVVCVTHLVKCSFQSTTLRSEEALRVALEADPLLTYAYESWSTHARRSLSERAPTVTCQLLAFVAG